MGRHLRAFESGKADSQPAARDLAIVGSTDQIGAYRSDPSVLHDLLSPGELLARLGGSQANFYRLQKLGQFRHLEVARPVGVRRYSRFKVEQFLRGESTVRFGRGARS